MTPAADREMAALEAQIKEGTDHGRQQEKKLLSRGAVRWEQAVLVMQAGGR